MGNFLPIGLIALAALMLRKKDRPKKSEPAAKPAKPAAPAPSSPQPPPPLPPQEKAQGSGYGNMSREHMHWIQVTLILNGYPAGTTGLYDDQTIAAVIAFQTDYGLEPDGKPGPMTQAKLAEVEVQRTAGFPIPVDRPSLYLHTWDWPPNTFVTVNQIFVKYASLPSNLRIEVPPSKGGWGSKQGHMVSGPGFVPRKHEVWIRMHTGDVGRFIDEGRIAYYGNVVISLKSFATQYPQINFVLEYYAQDVRFRDELDIEVLLVDVETNSIKKKFRQEAPYPSTPDLVGLMAHSIEDVWG